MKVFDYHAEITAAALAGDSVKLSALAFRLLGKVEADDERRAKDAARKRGGRASGTSRNSADVHGNPRTSADSATSVQTPKELRADNTPPREAVAEVDDVKLQGALDAMREKCGEQWPDVEAFLLRRDYAKWEAWLDEMHKLVKMGSQFTADDLARVCRDDRLLTSPLGSAFALRKFLLNARIERIGGGERSPPPSGARTGNPSRRDTNRKPAGTPAPPSDPDVPLKWT